jgi:ribosomal protein S27E
VDSDEIVPTILPHSSFGDPECCGCLHAVVEGEQAEILCNECGSILLAVPAADLDKTLSEMELTLDVATEKCPHCRSVNLLPGFSKLLVFTCRNCERVVRLSDGPDIERFFGKPS